LSGSSCSDPTTDSDLIRQLHTVARRTLEAAGPRYSPALDPDAPNLEIRSLQRAASALTLGTRLQARVAELRVTVLRAYERDSRLADRLFARRVVNIQLVAEDLAGVAGAASPKEARRRVMTLRNHVRRVQQAIKQAESETDAALRVLEDNQPGQGNGDERDPGRERERLRGLIAALRRLVEPLSDLAEFVDGPEGSLLVERSSILLLGEWGTGKTHFICDFALHSLANGVPAVVVLASMLREDIQPLDAIADATGIAANGAELLRVLGAAGAANGRRSVLLIDAINEADRDAWRKWLPQLVRTVAQTEHIGLLVSCRTPFDEAVITRAALNSMVRLFHPGFENQEFDAQLEFFRHYRLPALHVPLLTSEFSRPLFLRLMCEGVKDLSRRSQKSKLKDIASGQKSMTYVLEHFVKRVGAEVERAHKLPARACWYVMKGEPRRGRAGLAGVLARNRREWMYPDEAMQEVQAMTALDAEQARSVVKSMVGAGLLVEHSRYSQGAYFDVLVLPYQRFSDHLVARHLLDEHLDVSSEAKLRRCFYANQRLGAVFVPDRWGRQFAEPGIASALMIEFPERVKRLAAGGETRAELLAYLPKARRLLYPFVDTFLEGLYWRGSSGFSVDTEKLVLLLLDRDDADLRPRIYEVLFGLAARVEHPWGVEWLSTRLGAMTMPDRDLQWSEFLRSVDRDSNVYRLLSWAEREDGAKVEPTVVERAIRLLLLVLTTTDRRLRDRATRALVLLGDSHSRLLFEAVIESIPFNDPYVPERALAAAYGVCMRRWATTSVASALADDIANLSAQLLSLILRPNAPYATWHTLTRGYAIGVPQILRLLRPRALSRADRELLTPAEGHAPSPFRSAARIRKRDVEDPEHAIHMDFGNYTIGRLVSGRGNYDFSHTEYAGIRRQIAYRMRRLGYSTESFNEADRRIVQRTEYRQDSSKVDRYGKKYSWIAFYEMYGLRSASGKLDDHPFQDPRTSDCDIDPSFPNSIPEWNPPRRNVFDSSPVEMHAWLAEGDVPEYESLLQLSEVDGQSGEWILLDAAIREGLADYRELRGYVTSIFAPPTSVSRLRAEVKAGRDLSDDGFPDPGADYYTYHGEIPWSLAYGSDVRTTRGAPKRVSDRAFAYFDRKWKPGIPVEDTCRRWAWESHHSELNQTGPLVFPAPPLADRLNLRVVGGSSDMMDRHGRLATIYREAPGPGFGSHFLYMRRDSSSNTPPNADSDLYRL
jgi:hypothetical protein